MLLRVGEVSKQIGMSVRALHHYDEIGLLSPSHRSESGYRLYTLNDLMQLQKIKSLCQLGFALDKIKGILQDKDTSLLSVIKQHIENLSFEIEQQQVLIRRLEDLAHVLEQSKQPSVELMYDTLKETVMLEKYYTPDQLKELSGRKKQLGDAAIKDVGQEWKEIFEQFKKLYESKKLASSPEAQALAKRSQKLIDMFTGGNPAIAHSLKNMYDSEGSEQMLNQGPAGNMGVNPAVFAYFREACDFAKSE